MDDTTPGAGARVPAREVRTRRVTFDFPAAGHLPRHFMAGDLVMSHVVAALSAMFPEGEDFFVRSVRNCRDRVADPELRRQVSGFIGQEAMHGREHRRFNEALGAIGYPTWAIDRVVRWLLRIDAFILPEAHQLAVTAALEHYTATLAEVLLTDPRARDAFGAEEVLSLFTWHALEESEHKSVAFDVYQEVSGNEFVRIFTMEMVTLGFVAAVLASVSASLVMDPAARDLRRLTASLAELRHSPWATPGIYRHLRAYSRRGFHPDDRDTTALVARWRAQLFGAGGSLTAKLAESG